MLLCSPGVMQAPIAIELRAQAGPGPRPAGLGLERASGRAFGLLHGRPPESPGPREQGGARSTGTAAAPRGLRGRSRVGSTPAAAAGPGTGARGPPVDAGRGVLAAPALAGGVLYEAQENTPGIKPQYYPRE